MSKKVFLSYAFTDKTLVEGFKKELLDHFSSRILILEESQFYESDQMWKVNALKKLKDCSFVIALFGFNTWESEAVKWEISTAQGLNKKIFVIKLKSTVFMIPSYVTEQNIQVFDDFDTAFKCIIESVK